MNEEFEWASKVDPRKEKNKIRFDDAFVTRLKVSKLVILSSVERDACDPNFIPL